MYSTTRRFEEIAYVLDYLPQGRQAELRMSYQREEVVQAVGESFFTLLELIPRRNVQFSPRERLTIGKDGSDKIDHVKGRIQYEDLTATARNELPVAIENIISVGEARFVRFFNTAGPITTRLHQLQLLPGIGKKTMWEILDERKKKPFSSFQDLVQRVRIQDPRKVIVKRILMEFQNEDKYQVFTWKPKPPQQ
jgi:putative nucleotide binding protein